MSGAATRTTVVTRAPATPAGGPRGREIRPCGKTGGMHRHAALILLIALVPFALKLWACGGDDGPEVCLDSELTDQDDRMWTPCACQDPRTGDESRPDWYEGCLGQGNLTCVHARTKSICTRDCNPKADDCPPAFGKATVCVAYSDVGTCEIPCGDDEPCPRGMICTPDSGCLFDQANPDYDGG